MCSSKGACAIAQSEPASKFTAHRAVVPAIAWLLYERSDEIVPRQNDSFASVMPQVPGHFFPLLYSYSYHVVSQSITVSKYQSYFKVKQLVYLMFKSDARSDNEIRI